MEALRAKLAEQSAMWSNTLDKVAQSLGASEFDTNKPITFTGAMKGIETRLDQRVYVHVESKAANGSAITYRVLLGKANLLADTDQVTDLAKTFNPGDVLTVEGHRAKDPTSLDVGNATITRPDGRRIKLSN